MADALSVLNGFLQSLQLNFSNPVGLVINLILSTIVGGIVILIVAELFAKKFSEEIKAVNAFLLVLVASLIQLLGIVPLLGQFLIMVPMVGLLLVALPVIVWIVLVKVFFRKMRILHAVLLGVVCYFLTLYVIPVLVGMVSGFIPL